MSPARRAASRRHVPRPESSPIPDLPVVHEDRGIIVVDKPAGLPTVSPRAKAVSSAWSLLRRMLREREGPGASAAGGRPRGGGRSGPRAPMPLYLIHRLDQPASGLLIFARTERARDGLKEMLARREIQRVYAAVVVGHPADPAGEIHSKLVETGGAKPRVRSLMPRDGETLRRRARSAVTRYRQLRSRHGLTALELRLETGRKHQIRVHLAESGMPVLGDRLYGGTRSSSLRADRLLLHAWRLGFQHPVTRRKLELVSPPGRAFQEAVPGAFPTS